MSFRKPFSQFREKVKRELSKIGDRPERRGANVGGEGTHRSALPSQSEPGIVVEGEFRGGDIRVGDGNDDPPLDNSRPISRSVAGAGCDLGRSDDNADGGETGQEGLHPHPHMELESGSSRERRDAGRNTADQLDPPPQSEVGSGTTRIPSVSRGGESESTWTTQFQSLFLTDYGTGDSAAPDPLDADATSSKDKSDWKSTASSAAKLLLRTVERASDVFPPLKSAVAGLCAILDNCEVCSTFVRSI